MNSLLTDSQPPQALSRAGCPGLIPCLVIIPRHGSAEAPPQTPLGRGDLTGACTPLRPPRAGTLSYH